MNFARQMAPTPSAPNCCAARCAHGKRHSDQLLKVDAAGRVWTPRARREALLDEFERGGTPAAEFARWWAVNTRRLPRGCSSGGGGDGQRYLHRPAVAYILPHRDSATSSNYSTPHPPPAAARKHPFPKKSHSCESPSEQAPEPVPGQPPRHALRALRRTARLQRDCRGGNAIPVLNQVF